MIIDTHSHLQFSAYQGDRDEVVKKTRAAGIWCVNVGTSHETSLRAIEFARQYGEGFFAAVGLHPMYAASEFIKLRHDPDESESPFQEFAFDKEEYRDLARSEKVVAIGEIGLDYYYKPKTALKLAQFKEKQRQVFLQQLSLAEELHLPVILHCRMAHDEMIEMLAGRKGVAGVVHCFTGTLEQAKKYVGLGFFLGLNGIMFKFDIAETIRDIPLEKLLVETDCPYLAPPMAPEKRNEPLFIRYAVEKIAALKGTSFETVADVTAKNARGLFSI